MERYFLLVVDESPELIPALKFAALRAKKLGVQVALLAVIEQHRLQDWFGAGVLMEQERREAAISALRRWTDIVKEITGQEPRLLIEEGSPKKALMNVLENEKGIIQLILGASTQDGKPGPLVSHFAGKIAGKLPIPVTILSGALDDERIHEIV